MGSRREHRVKTAALSLETIKVFTGLRLTDKASDWEKALPLQLPVTELWTFHPGDLCDRGSSSQPTLGQIWTQTHANLVKLGILTKRHNSQLSDVTTEEFFFLQRPRYKKERLKYLSSCRGRTAEEQLFTEIKGPGDDKVKWATFCVLCHYSKENVYLFQTVIGLFA